MSGFVRLDRAAFEHPLLRDAKRFRAWFWMVAKACWKPQQFDINGKVVDLKRGQFVASRNQLAQEWGWSPSAVERFLTRLETEQMIGRATGQGRSLITIRNYNKFNPVEALSGQDNGQATGQAADKQRTAKEQGNKGTRLNTPLNPPKPEGVSDQVWSDWKRVRKKPITETVLKRTETEAAKIGWTLAEAITEAAESGWEGFKAHYVKDGRHDNRNNRSGGGQGGDGFIRALDRKLAGDFEGGGPRETSGEVGAAGHRLALVDQRRSGSA